MSLDWNRACWTVSRSLTIVSGNSRRTLISLGGRKPHEQREISRGHSAVNHIRSDKFSIGTEFRVGQPGGSQSLDRKATPPKTNLDDFIERLRKDVRSQKKQIIAENMGLSDAEAEKFLAGLRSLCSGALQNLRHEKLPC